MNLNIIDIINRKRLGLELNNAEIEYAFNGYLNNTIKDYQMSALLMAICINDMSDREIFNLTDVFIKSGEVLDLSNIDGVKVDKHSTGGVGDKTTLVIAPIVASCGVKIAKMSGRGLGFTGGTIDKLESIPGFNVNLTMQDFIKQVREINVAISSQTADLTPLDKIIYALRDVTATVESIPLIAASIMSKKIASGADKILIDIKVGNGALIKNVSDANRLNDLMIKIGKKYNKEVRTIISDMNVPLGKNVGNSLEVIEAMEILKGNVKSSLTDLCIDLASNLVSMAKDISIISAVEEVKNSIKNGSAYSKFLELVKYQNGNIDSISVSKQIVEIKSPKYGVIEGIDAYKIGIIARNLGAGRIEEEDIIDPGVGVVLNKTIGMKVDEGDILCYLYINDNSKYLEKDVLDSFTIK